MASVSPNGTFDTFIKFMWRRGCDMQFKKPLQITFAFKKEAEHSYVALNNNSNWAFIRYLSAIHLLFEVAFD